MLVLQYSSHTVVLKSYSEGPFHHEDQTTDIDRQTTDLKREVYNIIHIIQDLQYISL